MGRNFDLLLLLGCLLLWVFGIALIYSATAIHHTGVLAHVARNQILWVIIGLCLIFALCAIPTGRIYQFAYVLFVASLLLLVVVVFMGIVSKGANRWIGFGPLRIQPSEFAKIGLLLALARYFTKKSISLDRLSSFVMPGLLILVPFILVMQQPDLGTALVFCVLALPVFYWGGLSLAELFLLVSPIISLILSAIPLILSHLSEHASSIIWTLPWGIYFLGLCGFLILLKPRPLLIALVIVLNLTTATITTIIWNNVLQDYQKGRIISFINPQNDPFGAGYQVIQSKVAIGSGGFTGKGFLQGTQTRLSFLPEQHTDFIFSVLGEQFGFLGCAIVLGLFLFVLIRAFTTTREVRSRFSNIVIVGAATILGFHVFVNIAMTLGMMPVTGLPLPFLSYGGSFTLTVAILVGLILNARLSRDSF